MYNLKNKIEIDNIIKTWEQSERSKITIVYNDLINYLKDKNDIKIEDGYYFADLNENTAADFIMNKYCNDTAGTIRVKMSIFRKLMKELDIDVEFNSIKSGDVVAKLYEYPNRNELLEICDLLINYQDRFILYAVFCGFTDIDMKNLIELKITDIDFDNKTVKVNDENIIVDDIFLDLAEKTINQVVYYKNVQEDNPGTNEYYEFNMDSKFVLKPKPTNQNDGGFNSMSLPTLRQRFNILNDQLTEWYLTPRNLRISGFMQKMNDEKDDWTVRAIEAKKKELSYKFNAYTVFNIYNQKYNS
ncbi:hypothetical protein [Metaclostridioides mangenotii]|uniref:hypothetical protein n=1 Tax=Metaclostridioides mangenotii TaxID=1540 RepID=UPI000467AA31|nr:hypothetical protein [Clostridioides mangenotii]